MTGERLRPQSGEDTDEPAPGGEPATAVPTGGLGRDDTFALLSNPRRRLALRVLRAEGPTLTTGDLAEHVAAREHGIERAQLRSKQRKRVYISLYQNHLPQLADAGVIDYDPDRGTVRRGPAADRLYATLDAVAAVGEPDTRSAGGTEPPPAGEPAEPPVHTGAALGVTAAVIAAVSLPVVPAAGGMALAAVVGLAAVAVAGRG